MKKVITIFLMALAIMTVFVSCDDAPHVHEFSQDWKYDETYHWHPATCGDTEEVDGKGEHVWEYKAAEDKAKHIKTCKTCGYSVEEEHKNEYKLTDDKAEHYQVCTLCSAETEAVKHTFTAAVTEDKTKHQESCVCGYKKEAEDHIVEAWTIDKDSTEDEEGEKHGSCTVCGYLVKATVDMKEHTHKESENYGYDENTHWHKCTKAGCSYKFSEKEHSLTYVKDDADGHYQKCACGYTTVKENHDLKYVISSDGAYHQQKCETCGYITIETEHTYNISKYDTTNHWYECVCGEKDTKSAHAYSSDAVVKNGKAVKVCDTCKYENAVTGATITVKDEKALAEAVNAAGVSTVKFGNGIEITSDITVSQSITIDMNSCVMKVNGGSITAEDVVISVKNFSKEQSKDPFDIEGSEVVLVNSGEESSLYYPTLKGAIAVASGNDEIIILKNLTLESESEIEVNKAITIRLYGGSLENPDKIKIVDGGSIYVDNQGSAQDLTFTGAVAKTSQGEGSSGTYYPSLEDAINAVSNGTVTLIAGIDMADKAIELKKSLTLDLNEKTLSCDYIDVSGSGVSVTIKGNGTVATYDVAVTSGATLKLEGGTYNTTNGIWSGYWDKSTCTGGGDLEISEGVTVESQEGCVNVVGEGKATITGGTFTSKDNAVVITNGSTQCAGYGITISGGTFNGNIESDGYIACGIYMANTGTVNINGGTFNITGGIGILVRSGKLSATGGTITLTKKNGLTEGWVGDEKTNINVDSQIVIDKEAKYPGYENITIENSANFKIKDINGNDYTTNLS